MEDISRILSSGSNLILVHSNADADAIGSGIAIALSFPDSFLYAPSGVSRVGKKLLKELNMDILNNAELGNYDNIIVVDSHSDAMLQLPGFDWTQALVIDHHPGSENKKFLASLIDEKAVSTCEIVWSLLCHLGKNKDIGDDIALALLTGMIGDSGNFHHASPTTLNYAGQVLDASNISMEKAFSMFYMEAGDEVSQRISKLKGGQRLKYLRKGTWVVASSQVSSFESNVARGLINLGADVSFVASQDKMKYRITARANRRALDIGLHLGHMLRDIAEEIGAESGGHDGAAGLTGSGESEAILNICSEKTLAYLVKKDGG